MLAFFFFFNDTATTEIYTLSLHDALPICLREVDEVAARLDRAHAGQALCAARHLHAPRLYAALARPREQVQVSLPRVGVHEGRRQPRRPDAPTARAGEDHARRRLPARRRQVVPLPLRSEALGRY